MGNKGRERTSELVFRGGLEKEGSRGEVNAKVMGKSNFSRSFVRERSRLDVGVRFPFPSISLSFFLPPLFSLFFFTLSISPPSRARAARLFSLLERVRRHRCVLHRRLSYTEPLPLRGTVLLFVAIRDEET